MAAQAEYRSGTPLFAFDEELRVLSWNPALEELTGTLAEEALGLRCWQALGAHDTRGGLVCHAGCSSAREARCGRPGVAHDVVIGTPSGERTFSVSTIAVAGDGGRTFLHLFGEPRPDRTRSPHGRPSTRLTPRQREVLGLLADGLPAKSIASRLGLSQATVRNHIRGVLLALGAHSQLEAIARARCSSLLPV